MLSYRFFLDDSYTHLPYIDKRLLGAAYSGNLKKVKQLLEDGSFWGNKANINAYNNEIGNVLHHAVLSNNPQLIQYLLNKGLNIEEKNNKEETPLQLAIKHKKYIALKCLADAGANVDVTIVPGAPAIVDATFNNDIECVKCLAEHGANLEVEDSIQRTAMWLAVARGYPEIVKILIKHGASTKKRPRKEETDAFGNALYFKQYEIAKILIEEGYDIEKNYALYRYADNLEHTQFLIEQGANVNAQIPQGATPLMAAACSTEYSCIKLLLENGADPNIQDEYGVTALIWAVRRRDLQIVKTLIEYGADVSLKDKDKKSAYHYAHQCNDYNSGIIQYIEDVTKNPQQYQTKALNLFKEKIKKMPLKKLKKIHLDKNLLGKIIIFNQLETVLNLLPYGNQISFYQEVKDKVPPEQIKQMQYIIRQTRRMKDKR